MIGFKLCAVSARMLVEAGASGCAACAGTLDGLMACIRAAGNTL